GPQRTFAFAVRRLNARSVQPPKPDQTRLPSLERWTAPARGRERSSAQPRRMGATSCTLHGDGATGCRRFCTDTTDWSARAPGPAARHRGLGTRRPPGPAARVPPRGPSYSALGRLHRLFDAAVQDRPRADIEAAVDSQTLLKREHDQPLFADLQSQKTQLGFTNPRRPLGGGNAARRVHDAGGQPPGLRVPGPPTRPPCG